MSQKSTSVESSPESVLESLLCPGVLGGAVLPRVASGPRVPFHSVPDVGWWALSQPCFVFLGLVLQSVRLLSRGALPLGWTVQFPLQSATVLADRIFQGVLPVHLIVGGRRFLPLLASPLGWWVFGPSLHFFLFSFLFLFLVLGIESPAFLIL